MSSVYQFVAAPSTRPVEVLSVFTTEIDGEMVGLLTDPPSHVLGRPSWNLEMKMMHYVASVTKCLLDDRLRTSAELTLEALKDMTVAVLAAPTSTATVMVDGDQTLARTLQLNGLQFALADDLDRDCYAIVRPSGSSFSWPSLYTSADRGREHVARSLDDQH